SPLVISGSGRDHHRHVTPPPPSVISPSWDSSFGSLDRHSDARRGDNGMRRADMDVDPSYRRQPAAPLSREREQPIIVDSERGNVGLESRLSDRHEKRY